MSDALFTYVDVYAAKYELISDAAKQGKTLIWQNVTLLCVCDLNEKITTKKSIP